MYKEPILNDQITYYHERAGEYDEWHLRQGRYDRGKAHKRQWFKELRVAQRALQEEAPFGECLELACGTGLWTPQLACGASTMTAVDAVTDTIEINRKKVGSVPVRYIVADLFDWWPRKEYDFVFFGFWLSHVPRDRFIHFWEMVRAGLRSGGRVFFVDGLQIQDTTAKDDVQINDSGVVQRKLNDGRTFNIVKVFHCPDELGRQLNKLGWTGAVQTTGKFFYYGCVALNDADQLETPKEN